LSEFWTLNAASAELKSGMLVASERSIDCAVDADVFVPVEGMVWSVSVSCAATGAAPERKTARAKSLGACMAALQMKTDPTNYKL
jgi:hypothetical protein